MKDVHKNIENISVKRWKAHKNAENHHVDTIYNECYSSGIYQYYV